MRLEGNSAPPKLLIWLTAIGYTIVSAQEVINPQALQLGAKGTLIMTDTSSGVDYFRKDFLKVGEVDEMELDWISATKNRIQD